MNLEFLSLIPTIGYERESLGFTAAILVTIVAAAYALQVYRERLHINIATWLMIVLIDVLGLVLAYSTGNSQPSVHIAWLITDTLICLTALSLRVNWHWGRIETVSLVLFIVSLYVWSTTESLLSVVGYLVAVFFTLLPQALQYWHDRRLARKSAWIWIMNSLAIVMTIVSLETISFEYSMVSIGLLTMCLSMVMLALR